MPVTRYPVVELEDAYVLCRTLGHSWDNNPNGTVDSDLFKMAHGVLMLRCTRCTTERFDYIDKSMAVFQRYYRYPDKWHTIVGEGKRPNLRGEMFRRSLLVQSYKPTKRLRSVS